MSEPLVLLQGLLLMFVLGLRHGFDPDHIAMVDSMAYGRAGPRQPGWWTGAMFAAGHGVSVTLVAIAMQLLRRELTLTPAWTLLLDWLPVVLLAIAGTVNLRALLRPVARRPGSALMRHLRGHPLAAFGVGILFALVFDTAAHISAWNGAGTLHGPAAALLAGLAFTAGMVVVDGLDGIMMRRLLAAPGQQARYRRAVGWVTVVFAYAVAGYGAASLLWPGLDLDEGTLTLVGAAMVGAFVVLALWARRGATAADAPV